MKWQGCEKIHKGCGGRVRWVEAINTPGVGFWGHCLYCDVDDIPVELIIPIEKSKVEAGVLWEDSRTEDLSQLEWKDEDSWDENQRRLKKEIENLL